MIVRVTAQVSYTCMLDEEKAKEVIDYAKENEVSLEEAVWQLQFDGSSLNIYEEFCESDFSTESIDEVELENDEEDYLNEKE